MQIQFSAAKTAVSQPCFSANKPPHVRSYALSADGLDTVTLSSYLPEAVDDRLRAIAHQHDVSKADLLNQLLLAGLQDARTLKKAVTTVRQRESDPIARQHYDQQNMVLRTVISPLALDESLRAASFISRISKGSLRRQLVDMGLESPTRVKRAVGNIKAVKLDLQNLLGFERIRSLLSQVKK